MNIDHYLKLIFVTMLLIILLFINNGGYSSTQIYFQNSHMTIDSLLLKGDISAVKLKYDNHEFENYNSEELEVLFRNIDFVTTLDPNTIDEYVRHYKTLCAQYYIEYVGENAYKAYEKFMEFSLQNEKVDALNYYYISLFFKIHYFNTRLTSARNIYAQAYRYFIEEKYSDALETINSIKIYSGHNINLIAIEDSLKLLRKNIINKQIEYNTWHKTGLRTHKLFIGIIPSVLYFGAVSDVTIKIENAVSTFLDRIEPSNLREVHIRDIPPTINYESSFSINYLVLRKLMIGLEFGYTAFSISSDYNNSAFEDNIFFESKLRAYIFKPYIKYLFSEEIGLSPFFNIGPCYQTIQYDDAIAGTFKWYNPGPILKTDFGDFALKSENRIGGICEIGVEYISSTSTNLIFGSKIGGYYFFSPSSILNNYNITFSMSIGFIL